jgi:nucleotide-binding universal stress UspA family protein
VPAVRGRFLSFRFAANAMNILLAVDGSDCALRAARFLVRILEGAKAGEIHVVNVQAPLAYAEVLTAEQQTVVERSKRELGAQTAAGATDLLAAASLPCKLHVVVGEPGTAIAQLARQLGCELIVMGTRGMGAITGVVLGSVAAKVVHLADVPVTLVR